VFIDILEAKDDHILVHLLYETNLISQLLAIATQKSTFQFGSTRLTRSGNMAYVRKIINKLIEVAKDIEPI